MNLNTLMSPVCARDVKDVNTTIQKTSSQLLPAKTSCGILCSSPYPSSISRIILGTTIAGDTAAIIDPIMNASNTSTFKNIGAKIPTAHISKTAGTKHINTAGRPIFFKSSMSSDNPARVKIITSAIVLISDEISSIFLSIRFIANGPRVIPTIKNANIGGNFIFLKNFPNNKDKIIIIAILFNIKFLLYIIKKLMRSVKNRSHQQIFCVLVINKGVLHSPHLFP